MITSTRCFSEMMGAANQAWAATRGSDLVGHVCSLCSIRKTPLHGELGEGGAGDDVRSCCCACQQLGVDTRLPMTVVFVWVLAASRQADRRGNLG